MKISTKGEYGIRSLIELTQRYGQGYVQSTQIAEARNIPENYLYQLLITLRKAGLIRSRRGPQGGHMLARDPKSITLADAVIALEGPIAPMACVQDGVMDNCPYGDRCAVKDVWQEISDTTFRILNAKSFAELAARENEIMAAL